MNYFFKTKNIVDATKASEILIFFICICCGIILINYELLFLALGILISSCLNYILKYNISKPLFDYFNNDMPWWIGQGERPQGAKDCTWFTNCLSTISDSYGFPSGHSQFAGFVGGFLIQHIIHKYSKNRTFKKLSPSYKFSILVIILLIIGMMYSRININCHTIQQTIYGSLIGLIFGTIWYKILFFLQLKKYKKNIYKFINNGKCKRSG